MFNLIFYSPAKLNLFFRVLFKREDGYHEIASLYQAIDLFDELTFSQGSSDELTGSDPNLSYDHSNLVWKALQIFRQYFSLPNVKIHLEKRIPMQSGLGGGSSNAATALWALNQIAKCPANNRDLIEMGAKIGSDVSFFFSLGSAYCTGRGEIFEPVSIPAMSGYIAKPDFGLPTPLVYRETKVSELASTDPKKVLNGFLSSNPNYFNDLEISAFRVEPRLSAFKKRLMDCGFQTVSMTGSGTAFFCLGDARAWPKDISFLPFRSIQRKSSAWYCPAE